MYSSVITCQINRLPNKFLEFSASSHASLRFLLFGIPLNHRYAPGTPAFEPGIVEFTGVRQDQRVRHSTRWKSDQCPSAGGPAAREN